MNAIIGENKNGCPLYPVKLKHWNAGEYGHTPTACLFLVMSAYYKVCSCLFDGHYVSKDGVCPCFSSLVEHETGYRMQQWFVSP